MQKKKSSTVSSLVDFAKSVDYFGETVNFEIGGSSSHRSLFGAFLSLIVIAITLSYSLKQLMTMLEYGATQHLQVTEQNVNN